MYQLKQIPSEAQIRKGIRQIVFGRNVYCPSCKSQKVLVYENRYRCKVCNTKFSLLSHTFLSNLKLPLQQFWLVLWCWTTQVPVKQTVSFTQLSEPTIRHWFEIFRTHLPEDQDVLTHLVQLDEAYFGGRKGRALFMGKQVGSRKLAYRLLSHTHPAREDAFAFLQQYIQVDTKLNTDGAAIYKGIDAWWPVDHTRDMHKKFEFTNTSEIEGMFGVLRTFIRRMYHHVTSDKLPMLISEFCFRFSHPELFKSPWYYLQNSLSLLPTP